MYVLAVTTVTNGNINEFTQDLKEALRYLYAHKYDVALNDNQDIMYVTQRRENDTCRNY